MPCSVFSGSCSLCPWYGEEHCPYFHDHKNDKRYWVYVTNREESYLDLLANLDTKKEVIEFIKTLTKRKWAKKYRVAHLIDKRVKTKGPYYKVERVYTPYVELTITDGEYSWYTSVRLLLNTKDNTLSYYNQWTTSFFPYVDENQKINVEIIKPWDERLKFVDIKTLPWHPRNG